MNRQDRLKAIYDGHIIKAEIAVLDAYEKADTPASDDELAIAIHHLQTAKTQLEALRKDKTTIPPRPDGY